MSWLNLSSSLPTYGFVYSPIPFSACAASDRKVHIKSVPDISTFPLNEGNVLLQFSDEKTDPRGVNVEDLDPFDSSDALADAQRRAIEVRLDWLSEDDIQRDALTGRDPIVWDAYSAWWYQQSPLASDSKYTERYNRLRRAENVDAVLFTREEALDEFAPQWDQYNHMGDVPTAREVREAIAAPAQPHAEAGTPSGAALAPAGETDEHHFFSILSSGDNP